MLYYLPFSPVQQLFCMLPFSSLLSNSDEDGKSLEDFVKALVMPPPALWRKLLHNFVFIPIVCKDCLLLLPHTGTAECLMQTPSLCLILIPNCRLMASSCSHTQASA